MAFVTRLTLRSGDRAVLDDVVASIRATARRKGAEFKGPHSDAPTDHYVPQYRNLDGDRARQFPKWRYTVYTRRVEFVGHDDLPRRIVDRGFPESVHVEVEVEQQRPVGGA